MAPVRALIVASLALKGFALRVDEDEEAYPEGPHAGGPSGVKHAAAATSAEAVMAAAVSTAKHSKMLTLEQTKIREQMKAVAEREANSAIEETQKAEEEVKQALSQKRMAYKQLETAETAKKAANDQALRVAKMNTDSENRAQEAIKAAYTYKVLSTDAKAVASAEEGRQRVNKESAESSEVKGVVDAKLKAEAKASADNAKDCAEKKLAVGRLRAANLTAQAVVEKADADKHHSDAKRMTDEAAAMSARAKVETQQAATQAARATCPSEVAAAKERQAAAEVTTHQAEAMAQKAAEKKAKADTERQQAFDVKSQAEMAANDVFLLEKKSVLATKAAQDATALKRAADDRVLNARKAKESASCGEAAARATMKGWERKELAGSTAYAAMQATVKEQHEAEEAVAAESAAEMAQARAMQKSARSLKEAKEAAEAKAEYMKLAQQAEAAYEGARAVPYYSPSVASWSAGNTAGIVVPQFVPQP